MITTASEVSGYDASDITHNNSQKYNIESQNQA